MPLADLMVSLRIDLADPDSELFTDDELTRCIHKGAVILARDLDRDFRFENDEIVPEMEGEERELLLLLGGIHACQIRRMKTANVFSFSSGDKRVDQTKQPEFWADLENDLLTLYSERIVSILSAPCRVKPLIYEQGGSL